MRCRQCGTEIADKALICYKCGTATTEAKYKPPVTGEPRRSPSRLVVFVLVLAVMIGVALYVVLRTAAP